MAYTRNKDFAEIVADICDKMRENDKQNFDRNGSKYVESAVVLIAYLKSQGNAAQEELKLLKAAHDEGCILGSTLDFQFLQELAAKGHIAKFNMCATKRFLYVFTDSELYKTLSARPSP